MLPRRPGGLPYPQTTLSAGPASSPPFPGRMRAPLLMPTPRPARPNFADVLPNLLLTTLSLVAAPPFVQRADASAPPPKIQVQCDQAENLIRLPLPDFAPVGSQLSDSAPAIKAPVYIDQIPSRIGHPLPDFLPPGAQVSASAPIVKPPVECEQTLPLIGRTLPDFMPIGRRVDDSAKPKYAIGAPLIPGQIAQPPGPLPIGRQVFDSAPPPKFRVTGPLFAGQTFQPIAVVASALPIGARISDSAPAPKFRNTAPLLIATGFQPPPPLIPVQIPAWADFDQVPAPSRFLPPFDPPNLILSTLGPTAVQAPAWADFDPVPPKSTFLPPFDPPNLILSTLLPPVPPPALPLGLPVDTSKFGPKFSVQVDFYPNTLILGIPPPIPPPTPPVTGIGSNPGGGGGGGFVSGKFEFSRKPLPRPPLTEAEYNRLPLSRQFVKDQHSVEMTLDSIVQYLEKEEDDDDEALLLLL
jgi:hypothetical protein